MTPQVEQLKISGQLPTPRGVALAIIELTRRESATLGEIARVVQTDPALSGRLLKLANAASQNSRPIASVQESVTRLGTATVRQLALGFSLLDQYRSGTCEVFDYQAYWSHSLLMALTMQALGQRVRVAAADELFICGLMSQVGRLALATAYPDEYSAVLKAHQADPAQPLLSHERASLETDHTELGIVMMADWGMPKIFTEPLTHYENPDYPGFQHDARSSKLMKMLRLSHRLADLGLANDDARPKLAAEWVKQAVEFDLPAEQVGDFIDQTIASWQEWSKLLKIPAEALPPFSEICRGDHAAETTATENEAALRIVVADGNAITRRKTMALLVEESNHVV
jgi:two-component system, cell cycle response regulator